MSFTLTRCSDDKGFGQVKVQRPGEQSAVIPICTCDMTEEEVSGHVDVIVKRFMKGDL